MIPRWQGWEGEANRRLDEMLLDNLESSED